MNVKTRPPNLDFGGRSAICAGL